MRVPSWLRPLAARLSLPPARRSPRSRTCRPRVEGLEDRAVPAAVSPPAGLTNWWPGDGTLNDVAGNRDVFNGPDLGYLPGQVGQAFNFDGSYRFVLASGFSSSGQDPRTIEAWVKPAETNAPDNLNNYFPIYSHQDFTFGIGGPSLAEQYRIGNGFSVSTLSVTPDAWNHVAMAYDGLRTTYYVNGQWAGTRTGILTDSIGSIRIGGPGPRSGLIDELSLYNRALSAEEILSIYQAGPDGKNRFFVQSNSPVDGETVNTPPTTFTVRLSKPYDPATVQSGDLLVNSVPATSVTQDDAHTLTFHYTVSPVTTAGAQSMTLSGGAILADGTGAPVEAWSRTFTYTPLPVAPGGHFTEFTIPTPNSTPTWITLGPDGNVWFAELTAVNLDGGGKLGRITPDGDVTEYDTPYPRVGPIVAGPDGNLWFTQNNVYDQTTPEGGPLASKIGVMSPAGASLAEYTLPPSTDAVLAVGPDGSIWATQYWDNDILKYNSSGQLLATYSVPPIAGHFGASNVAVGPDGTVWLTPAIRSGTTGYLGRISPEGVVSVFSFSGRGLFRGLVVDASGQVWTGEVDRGYIARVSPTGTLLAEYAIPTPGSEPYSLALGPDGNVWFTDQAQHQIGRVTLQGQITLFPTPTANSTPVIITAGPGNTLWFTEQGANKIGRFDLGQPPGPVVVLRDGNGVEASSFNEGAPVFFDASGTTDPEGDAITRYQWDFDNDGWFDATGIQASYSFGDNGVHPVRLKVTDDFGVSVIKVVSVHTNDVAPTAGILNWSGLPTNTSGHLTAPEGTSISLRGEALDPSWIDFQAGASFSWGVTKGGSPYGTGSSEIFTFQPDDEGTYVVTLTVTNKDGSGTSSIPIDVTNVAPSVGIASGAGVLAGEPDPTFGIGGRVSANPIAAESAYAAALQSDGKTVVVASYVLPNETTEAAVIRYLPNGDLDLTFGTNGVALTGLADARGVVIQSDGRIVVATSSSLVRLNPDGTLDAGFGTGGTVSVTGLQSVAAVALQGDDVLVAGLRDGGPAAFALARFTANGAPDSSFGPDQTGVVYAPVPRPPGVAFNGPTVVSALTVSGDQILVGGVVDRRMFFNINNGPAYTVARFNENGILDTSFGGFDPLAPATPIPGWAIESNAADYSGYDGRPLRMAVQPGDGKIILVGDHLVRFTATGALDAQALDVPVPLDYLPGQMFDSPVLPLYLLHSQALAVQPDGKLLLVGALTSEYNPSQTTYTDTLVLARLNADLTADTTFGTNGNGQVVLGFGPGRGLSLANLLLQSDGKILIVGSSTTPTPEGDLALVRLMGTATTLANEAIDLTATATDPSPVDALDLAYSWSVAGGPWHADSTVGPTFRFTPEGIGTYTVTVTVTDPDGAATTATVPLTVTPNVTITGLPGDPDSPSAPVGMTINLGSLADPIQPLTGHTWAVTRAPNLTSVHQYADHVIYEDTSSEWSSTDWSASQALGAPNVGGYADDPRAWSGLTPDDEYLALGFDTSVYADGVTIWETYGNGFVTGVDVRDTDGYYHPVWTGTDTSPPGIAAAFRVNWPVTSYLVSGVRIYVGVGSQWPEIDAVQLHGWDHPVTAFASGTEPDFAFEPDESGLYVVTLTARTQAGQTVRATATITANEMSAGNLQEALPSDGGTVNVQATTQQAANDVVAAVNGLSPPAEPVTVVVDLGGGEFTGITASPPANVTLVFENGTFNGASPALTVTSGVVVVLDSTLTNTTDAPTILVTGGRLVLRDSVIQESTGYAVAAILVTGGTLDLGTATDPGGNTLNVNGPGSLIRNTGANPVTAVGNAWQVDGATLADGYAIEDRVFHALDAGGGGLVSWDAATVYVTPASGSIQRGVAAIAPGGTVKVAGASYPAYAAGAKPLTVAFQNGPTFAFLPGGLDPTRTDLTVTGTAAADAISFAPGGAGAVTATVSGFPAGAFAPTGRLVAYGLGGDDDVQVAGSVSLPAWLYGGGGDDRLKGGNGHDVLLGQAGDDLLVGGQGRDLLIGGVGADRVVGNADDDVLVAGVFSLEDTAAALAAVMAEWTRTDKTAEARVANLQNGGGLNGSVVLNATTLANDLDADVLTGSSGYDWFLFDSARDRATDLHDEAFTLDLPFIND